MMLVIGCVVLFFNILFLLVNILGVTNQQKPYKVINNILRDDCANTDRLIYNKNGTYNTTLLIIILIINYVYFALCHISTVFLIFYGQFIIYSLFIQFLPRRYLTRVADLTVFKINNLNKNSSHFDVNFHLPSRIRYGVGCLLATMLIGLNILLL